jgi:ubiquitin carboxyl-terminal hydrolase 7
VKFEKLPPVLCLHLLRFEYDYNSSQNRKINDYFPFDYHLDLNEFLEKPNCSSCTYKLLSILVHSGDNSSGHYVSFINPTLDGQVKTPFAFSRI